MTKKRVVVAMSGGVDSSVSAALLVEQGYDVMGMMLRLWSEPGAFDAQRDNRCCTRDQMLDAHFVAKKLGIPFEVIDARDVFKAQIVDRFVEGYAQGITPNPCLSCNRHIRFGVLLNEALARAADFLATGHYARVTQGSAGAYQLRRGVDDGKDQSYVLSVLNQEQLRRAMFPVGAFTKPEVREMARRFGLPVASKNDSQDLCFVADGNYRRFLETYAAEAMQGGLIQLTDGTPVGKHSGLPNYTIGQRKGLGVAWNKPLYVLAKDSASNALIVGTRGELGTDSFHVEGVNWISGQSPTEDLRVEVKIRYKAHPAPATIRPIGRIRVEVRLDEPLPDVTPGQGAVFYAGDMVLGSGVIV